MRARQRSLRQRVGDWEGDLVTGRMNKSAIGVRDHEKVALAQLS
jgi:IS30 family transposase